MHVDVAVMDAQPADAVPRKRRRRAPSIARVDRRTKLARRVRDLATSYTHFFGNDAGLTPILRADILRAAELTALAEAARGAALRAGTVDIESLARLEGAADRAVRRLRLPVKAADTVSFRDRCETELGDAAPPPVDYSVSAATQVADDGNGGVCEAAASLAEPVP
jgi:hypothetical protein